MSFATARYEIKTYVETEVIEMDIIRHENMIIAVFPDFENIVILCPPNDNFKMFRIVSNIIRSMYAQCGYRGVSVRFLGVYQDQEWVNE